MNVSAIVTYTYEMDTSAINIYIHYIHTYIYNKLLTTLHMNTIVADTF